MRKVIGGWGGVGSLLDYIVSPSPIPFPLDFRFWILDLDFGLGFWTGLGLDNFIAITIPGKFSVEGFLSSIISFDGFSQQSSFSW